MTIDERKRMRDLAERAIRGEIDGTVAMITAPTVIQLLDRLDRYEKALTDIANYDGEQTIETSDGSYANGVFATTHFALKALKDQTNG